MIFFNIKTPLHLAAIENKIEIVEYLVKVANADIEIKDNSGVFFFYFILLIHREHLLLTCYLMT